MLEHFTTKIKRLFKLYLVLNDVVFTDKQQIIVDCIENCELIYSIGSKDFYVDDFNVILFAIDSNYSIFYYKKNVFKFLNKKTGRYNSINHKQIQQLFDLIGLKLKVISIR